MTTSGLIDEHTLQEVKPEPPGAFLKAFLRAPLQLGTCFSSSKGLARAMVRHLPLAAARVVFELGSGTGPLTFEVLKHLSPGCRFFAVEMNPLLAGALRERFPSVRVVEGDATRLLDLCAAEGVPPARVDAVCTSLPYMLFPPSAQAAALDEVHAALRPGGRMVNLTYWPEELHPRARSWRRLLDERFPIVRRAEIVWTNIPPAFVYWAQK